ncbi:MAG: hypothetical protein WCC00_02945 [Candidatus Aminicenantales bacterium]
MGVFIGWDRLSLWPTLSLCGIGFLVFPTVFRFVFKQIFPNYKKLLAELHRVESEVRQLKSSVQAIYDKYRERNKGERFKRTYELVGKRMDECEKRLAVGMSREQKEVFVVCFIKGEEVVRVTASIGSVSRCSASDNPMLWKQHIERLGCTEIRQYHNHPIDNNRTAPSLFDYKTALSMKQLLGKHGNKLRSFLIYWNQIDEWRIMEYDESGKYWLVYELDIAASPHKGVVTKLA